MNLIRVVLPACLPACLSCVALQNIGAMQITRVGSRRVIQLGACCAIIMGLIGKQGIQHLQRKDGVFGCGVNTRC